MAFAAIPSASSTVRATRTASRYCRAAPSRSPLRRYASALRLASITAASPDEAGPAGGCATQAPRNASPRTADRTGDFKAGIGSSALRARSAGRFEAVHRQSAQGLHFNVVAQEPGIARRAHDVLAVAHELSAVAQQARHLDERFVEGLAVFSGRVAY